MDSSGFSYKRTLSNNNRDSRASQAVNDWANKKKEQIEKAKQLREERKYGSTQFKSAAENSLQSTPHSNNASTNLRTTNKGYTPNAGMPSLYPSNSAINNNFGYPNEGYLGNNDDQFYLPKSNFNDFGPSYDQQSNNFTPQNINRRQANNS